MVSLADLRARNVTPVWQEAVAVVQELIQTVKATTGSAELLPDLEHIALIPNGDVVALPGSPEPSNPVRHAAVMLKLLVEGIPTPPELESFISRNVGDPPQYDNVAEFSRNLAFFERPGRRADVERLVGRAIAAEQTSRADEELRRLKERASEVTQAMPAPDFLQQPQKRVKTIPIPVIAVLGVVVIAGALWAWQLLSAPGAPAPETAAAEQAAAPPVSEATPPPAEAPSMPAAAPADSGTAAPADGQTPAPAAPNADQAPKSLIARAGDAVRSAVNTLIGSNPPASAAAPAPATTAKAEPTRQRPRRRAAQQTVTAATPAPAAAREPVAPAPAPAPPVETMPTEIDRSFEAPVEVFTARDEGVTPPVIVRPVLPKDPPPDVPPADIGVVEVVVDENGDVLHVKLISPANRYRERMLVSASKMWKFRPAYKDGVPVRYKTRVRLTI
jgi:cytoskeletal protein RodZ